MTGSILQNEPIDRMTNQSELNVNSDEYMNLLDEPDGKNYGR